MDACHVSYAALDKPGLDGLLVEDLAASVVLCAVLVGRVLRRASNLVYEVSAGEALSGGGAAAADWNGLAQLRAAELFTFQHKNPLIRWRTIALHLIVMCAGIDVMATFSRAIALSSLLVAPSSGMGQLKASHTTMEDRHSLVNTALYRPLMLLAFGSVCWTWSVVVERLAHTSLLYSKAALAFILVVASLGNLVSSLVFPIGSWAHWDVPLFLEAFCFSAALVFCVRIGRLFMKCLTLARARDSAWPPGQGSNASLNKAPRNARIEGARKTRALICRVVIWCAMNILLLISAKLAAAFFAAQEGTTCFVLVAVLREIKRLANICFLAMLVEYFSISRGSHSNLTLASSSAVFPTASRRISLQLSRL